MDRRSRRSHFVSEVVERKFYRLKSPSNGFETEGALDEGEGGQLNPDRRKATLNAQDE
jgi:hypothetical protein